MPDVTTIQEVDIPRAISAWQKANNGSINSIRFLGDVPESERTLADFDIEWGSVPVPTEQDLVAIWNEKIQPIIDNPPPEPEEEEPIEIVSNDPVVNDLFQRVQRIEAQIEQLLSR